MAEHDPETLSEEEAARLWERAAQLQAEAAKSVEAPEVHGADLPPASSKRPLPPWLRSPGI